jgi:RimJ/RimL family protein N-acetyltransferase
MCLTFRGVSLRPVLEADLPFLFRLIADPGLSHLWMRGQPAFDEVCFQQNWANWGGGMVSTRFVVESAGRPVGMVFDYDRTPHDGWTKATTLLQEESLGHGGGVIATALFMDWLFRGLPLRKVYHEAYGYNAAVVRMWRKLGLREEGVLRGDRYWDGAYWDLHIFALYREDWPRVRDRVLRPAGVRREPAGPVPPEKEVKPTNPCLVTNGCRSGADGASAPAAETCEQR